MTTIIVILIPVKIGLPASRRNPITTAIVRKAGKERIAPKPESHAKVHLVMTVSYDYFLYFWKYTTGNLLINAQPRINWCNDIVQMYILID